MQREFFDAPGLRFDELSSSARDETTSANPEKRLAQAIGRVDALRQNLTLFLSSQSRVFPIFDKEALDFRVSLGCLSRIQQCCSVGCQRYESNAQLGKPRIEESRSHG